MALFVGRRRELEVLRARLHEVSAGRGGVALLAGEPGIGKTTAARHFAAIARAGGALVLWGACLDGDLSRPYGPWVEAFEEYARALPAEELRAQLGANASVLALLLPTIRHAFPDLPVAPALSPDEERFRLYDALVQFLETLTAQRPALLILDDLHWGDRDSLRLLRHLAHFAGRMRLLLVGLYRPADIEVVDNHPLAAALAQLVRDPGYARLALDGLSIGEVGAYLQSEAAGPLLPELVRTIHTETGGNPFYTREVFRHLLEAGQLERRDGEWGQRDALSRLGIPEGVRQVVGQRLALLSPAANQALRIAAALSGGFSFPLLRALTGDPDSALLDAVDEALRAGLIQATDEGYEFAHAIVRHTLYHALNPDRRRHLHRQIAEALERLYGDRAPEHAAELATQYHAAAPLAEAERGIPYCLLAAEEARRDHAPELVVTFLRMARDLASTQEAAQRATILCKLAAAEAAVLLLDDARRTVDQALAALDRAGDGDTAARFLAEVARALKDGGAAQATWEPLVARGLTLLGAQRDLTWARLTLLLDHFTPLATGTFAASRWQDHDPRAVEIARADGDEEEDYARSVAPYQWRTGQESRQLLALARSWTTPFAVLRALDLGARGLLFHHRAFAEARTAFEELLAAGERYGAIPAQAEALVQLACCQVVLGDLADARAAQERAQALIARLGPEHRLRLIAALMNGSLLAYYLGGDWAGLVQGLASFLATPASARTPHGLLAAGMRALALAQLGDRTGARQLLTELTPVLARVEPQIYVANIAADAAAIAVWELGLREFALAYERLAGRFLAADVGVSFLSVAPLNQARMQALRGQIEEARASFAHARTTLTATGQRPLLAIADRDEALALARTGRSAQALIDAAAAASDALGMDHWVAQIAADRQHIAALPASVAGSDYPGGLTARQVEILRLVAGGVTNREIAETLRISLPTVERHIANIYTRIDARGRADATAYAFRHGLIPPS